MTDSEAPGTLGSRKLDLIRGSGLTQLTSVNGTDRSPA
jgi:hypothetical protein